MMSFLQIFICLIILIIIGPQTEQYNIVLNFLYKTEFFIDYKEVKIFLKFFSWILIILFLIFSIL
jgi:hypothetical protein